MKETVFKISTWTLALMFIIFGANKLLGFLEVPPPSDPIAQQFMGAMFTTYLFRLVAITQILGGLLLLIPRTAFLGLLLLLPVMANIIGFHLAHEMPGNGLWLIALLLTGIVSFRYKAYFGRLLI